MGLLQKTNITAVCDHCGDVIDGGNSFLRMSEYELTFHLNCFTKLTPGELLHHMGYDKTTIHKMRDNGTFARKAVRLRDPRGLCQDDTLDHSRSTDIDS